MYRVHLVVDMQNRYVQSLLPEEQQALPSKIDDFINRTHQYIAPIYIETVDEDMFMANEEERKGYSSVFTKKVFNPSLGPRSSSHEKKLSSAFEMARYGDGNRLHSALKKIGAQEVILSGLHELICVGQTAFEAAKLGYKTTILSDLCGNGKHIKPSENYPKLTQEFCALHGVGYLTSDEYFCSARQPRDAAHSFTALAL